MNGYFRFAALLAALVSILPAQAQQSAPPVVVELFTSQGCSSCPPADAYLGELARRPGILALGFHIDYWNYIGWTDPYSLPIATARQRDYRRRLHLHYVYTPQMVIDGVSEGIGSEPGKIAPLIEAARRRSPDGPAVSLERRGATLHLHVGAAATSSAATVWLVGIDRAQRTPVARGENQGNTAQDYQIVRSFTAVATWRGQPLDLDLPAASASGDEAAALVQRDGTGPIIAAAVSSQASVIAN